MLSIFVSAFERGHEILRSIETSNQIGGVLERKKLDVLLIRRMRTGNSSNFLIEVVLPDLSMASLVNHRDLNEINGSSWCDSVVCVRSGRLS